MKKLRCILPGLIVAAVFLFPFVLGLSFYREEAIEAKEEQSGIGNAEIAWLDVEKDEIKKMALEKYLVGVLAAEMPAEYHIEALKAQAVAARSFILSRADEVNPDHPGAVVCNDFAHCKSYIDEDEARAGWDDKKEDEYWEKLSRAVEETCGEYMVCEGETVEAFFFARSGGRTENSEEVWGEARPYLKSVESAGDIAAKDFLETVEVSNSEARARLCRLNTGIQTGDAMLKIGKASRTEGGTVATLEIDGYEFKGAQLRSIFGLKSANFSVEAGSASVIFTTAGYGHGVGMSQFGADYMADNGKNYTEILSHYYTNIQIIKG